MKTKSNWKDLATAIPTFRPRTRRLLRHPRRKRQKSRRPVLRFSASAWAKLLFLRDYGDTEVGGFGICAPNDLLLVQDVRLVNQRCTPVTVAFQDAAVADFFDEQIDAGLRPEQFGRVWIHTHPGESPLPSLTDEATFARVFGRSDWAVMFILARGGAAYARLQFTVGPAGSLRLPVRIAWEQVFSAANHSEWAAEYSNYVREEPTPRILAALQRNFADEFGDSKDFPILQEASNGRPV